MGRFFSKVLSVSLVAGALYGAGCHPPEPCVDMTGCPDDMKSSADLSGPPADMTMVPVDMTKPPEDMAKPPGDMAGPPADMTGPPADMTGPPRDMTGPPADMTGPPADMTGPPADMTGPPRDMAGMPGDMSMPPTDMSMPPRDMSMPAGGIGAPCTDDSQCMVGPSKKCWKSNVLNNMANPPTPGGYCSSGCATNADCGSGNTCVDIGAGKYCLAGCNNATTCRNPGYACSYYGGAGVCFPDTIFDCDPKAAGTCTEAGTGKMGGCLRGAFENKGNCSATCSVGAGACAPKDGAARQCNYVDNTNTSNRDVFKGTICLETISTTAGDGAACNFVNDCKDGFQCDKTSNTCKQLCGKGGMPACSMGMCQDAFMTPAMGAGICR